MVESYSPGGADVYLYLTHAFMGSPKSILQTVSWSVQLFLQVSQSWQTDRPHYSVCNNRLHLRSTAMLPKNLLQDQHRSHCNSDINIDFTPYSTQTHDRTMYNKLLSFQSRMFKYTYIHK